MAFALREWGFAFEHSWPQSSELLLAGSLAVGPLQRSRAPPHARARVRSSGNRAPALLLLAPGQGPV